ncbi:MAG: sialidase family protein [Verrucomicrobiota bacterium]
MIVIVLLALGCAGCLWSPTVQVAVPQAVCADKNNLVRPKKPELIAAVEPTPGWVDYTIQRMNGAAERTSLPAHFQLVTATWGHENAQMPNLVYMPEKKRLLMTIEYGPPPVRTVVIYSDDLGATWSERRWLHTDAQGKPDVGVTAGLTHLGNGFLTTSPESGTRYFSHDYGLTWTETAPVPKGANGRELYHWDPLLVDRDKAGKIMRLAEARWNETGALRDDPRSKYSQAYLWFSTDLGKSWGRETSVPAWYGVNEVALVRAKNGDIVAACRTDNPVRFKGELDLYSGMGVSISRDNGATWSDLNRLYEYGRHHPSLVVLPNGDLVMPYVVRVGYPDTKDGFPRFGIEAMISHDHGQTWDLDHKYLLAYWTGKVTGRNSWWGLSQTTSTVRLPDGTLLTAFGTGFRNESTQPLCKMDVGLVRWRVSDRPTNSDRTLRDAPFDSELRNRFEPEK